MPNTITADLTCIINVIKYNFREDWSPLDSCKAFMSCRSYQRQLTRQVRMIAKLDVSNEQENRLLSEKCKEGISKQARTFYHANILYALKSLRCKFEECSG